MHMALRAMIPAIITLLFSRSNWKMANIVMMLTTIVDAGRFLANPIYDASRCSIGFHPLHRLLPIQIFNGANIPIFDVVVNDDCWIIYKWWSIG